MNPSCFTVREYILCQHSYIVPVWPKRNGTVKPWVADSKLSIGDIATAVHPLIALAIALHARVSMRDQVRMLFPSLQRASVHIEDKDVLRGITILNTMIRFAYADTDAMQDVYVCIDKTLPVIGQDQKNPRWHAYLAMHAMFGVFAWGNDTLHSSYLVAALNAALALGVPMVDVEQHNAYVEGDEFSRQRDDICAVFPPRYTY